MVDLLVAALPEFQQDATVAIAGIPASRMISNNLANVSHEPLAVFAGAVRTAFSVAVGALCQSDCLQAPVQSVVPFTLTGETDLLSR